MAKLLKINAKVHLPGATGAKWRITWPPNEPYLMARILSGGLSEGELIPVEGEPDFWTWPASDKVFGGVLGDKPPPLVTMRVMPTVATGKAVLPISYQGHPREIVADAGEWDLSRIGGSAGPVLATEAQLAKLDTLDAKASRADADHALSVQTQADTAQERARSEAARALLLSTQDGSLLRYPTDAARNAASPPNGTWGWAADVNNYRHRETGAWVSYDPASPPPDTGVL